MFTHVSLSPSNINWCWLKGSDVVGKARSVVALAVCLALPWFVYLPAQGLRKGDDLWTTCLELHQIFHVCWLWPVSLVLWMMLCVCGALFLPLYFWQSLHCFNAIGWVTGGRKSVLRILKVAIWGTELNLELFKKLIILLHPTASRTTWVSRHQIDRTVLDFNEARDDWGGSRTVPIFAPDNHANTS